MSSRSGGSASYHLVGKDILTTHSVYWSTMLFAMGHLQPAQCLYAHGWWTIEGQKMSKSIGNVVDPHLIDCYGADAVRYFPCERSSSAQMATSLTWAS